MEYADLSDQRALVWASEPMRIGKHEWRIVVFTHDSYGPVTQYEFRGPRAPFWAAESRWNAAERHWRGCDGNHASGGMPKSLAKLFNVNESTIRQLIPRH